MKKRVKNSGVSILFFLMGGFFVTDAYSKSLEVGFIGNEAFRITDGDYVLVTDFPYKSGIYGYMEYEFNFQDTTGHVLSLITHRHEDHFAPLLFVEQGWNIVGPSEVTQQLAQNKVVKLADEITFGPIKITPKKTFHANTEHYSYLVNWGERHLFFTGDTEALETLKNLPELDALFISPWFYRKARLNNALPETKKIIIYHHTDKDIIPNCPGCIIPRQNQIIDIN